MSSNRERATRASRARRLFGSRRGNNAVEYALLFGLMGSVVMGSVSFAGVAVSSSFENVSDSLGLDGGERSGNDDNRSGLGDDTNPSQGSGTDNSPNEGTDNPNNAGSGGPPGGSGSGGGSGHF